VSEGGWRVSAAGKLGRLPRGELNVAKVKGPFIIAAATPPALALPSFAIIPLLFVPRTAPTHQHKPMMLVVMMMTTQSSIAQPCQRVGSGRGKWGNMRILRRLVVGVVNAPPPHHHYPFFLTANLVPHSTLHS